MYYSHEKELLSIFPPSAFTFHSSVLVVIFTYNIHAFEEAFFCLSNYEKLKKIIFMFPWQPLVGKQIFTSKECRLIIEALYEKVKSNNLIVLKKIATNEHVVPCC